MPSVKYEAWALFSLGLLFPALAQASEALPSPAASDAVNIVSPAEFAAPIAADVLEQYRGGSIIKSEAISNGLLQDATATNIVTGNNSIADGAFANVLGLPIVIQNSGANVLIQNSTIVNVQFR